MSAPVVNPPIGIYVGSLPVGIYKVTLMFRFAGAPDGCRKSRVGKEAISPPTTLAGHRPLRTENITRGSRQVPAVDPIRQVGPNRKGNWRKSARIAGEQEFIGGLIPPGLRSPFTLSDGSPSSNSWNSATSRECPDFERSAYVAFKAFPEGGRPEDRARGRKAHRGAGAAAAASGYPPSGAEDRDHRETQ
jgi:hypothetical protein